MIKIDEKKIYMTFGEGCYVLARDGEKIKPVCFGARIEPEDDMSALAYALSTDADRIGGDELCGCGGDFAFVSAEKVQKPSARDLPSLAGDNTLKLVFADGEKNLEQVLYYTPYTRGAISRRIEITNKGARTVVLKNLAVRFSLPPRYEKLTECGCGAIVGENGGDGAAYGFITMFGGGCAFDAESAAGETSVRVKFGGTVKIKAGETAELPEVLAAYSDNGTDGVSRIFHDILRERAVKSKRRPVAVECDCSRPSVSAAEVIAGVAALGADTLITRFDDTDKLVDLSDKCGAPGIGLGVRFESDDEVFAAVEGFDREYIKTDDAGNKYFDFALEGCARFFAAYLEESLPKSSVRFLALPRELPKLAPDLLYGYLCGQYKLLRDINEKLPELGIEGSAGDIGSLVYASAVYCGLYDSLKYSVYFPPCTLACNVRETNALKTAFDSASLYLLGYELDPSKLSEQLQRAIRAQIFCYQDEGLLISDGDFYRGVDFAMSVSKDKSRAYAVYRRGDVSGVIGFCGLDAHNIYHVRELNKTFSGAALARYGIPACSVPEGETVSFHLRQVADFE